MSNPTPYRQLLQRSARRRGSVIVLVIVALVLMAMIGTSYLQVARVQRGQAGESAGDIDTVVQAVLAQIATELGDDVVDDAGNYLDGSTTNQDQGDESYDYPWVNRTNAAPNTFDVIQLTTGAAATAVGGHLDDMWLASSSPTDWAGTTRWPNITNLNGVYLSSGVAGQEGNLQASAAPTEQLINQNTGDIRFRSFDQDVASTLLVDVDQDGIGDSRWAWATIPVIEGKAYVMAVRIVDISGRINLNTATSLVDASGLFDTSADGANAPRWDTPAELNFGQFVGLTAETELVGSSGAKLAELDNDLIYRLGAGSKLWTPRTTRSNFWDTGGSQTATGGFPDTTAYPNGYLINSQFELMRGAGVETGANTSAPFEARLSTFFRDGAGEANYAAYGTMQQFFETNPRLHTTVLSGITNYAPSLNTPSNNEKLLLGGTTTAAAVRERVYAVFNNYPVQPNTLADTNEMADQFTANLFDYLDADNHVTAMMTAPSVTTRYGLEALPFLAEVYVERPYTAVGAATGAGPYVSEWTQNGDAGYAIEITNPFTRPILLDDVELWIEGGDVATPTSTLVGELFDLAENGANELSTHNTTASQADDPATTRDEGLMLWPGDRIVFYHDPAGTLGIASLVDITGGNVILVDITTTANAGAGVPWPSGVQAAATPYIPAEVTVGLRATDQTGTIMTTPYHQITNASFTAPDLLTNQSDANTTAGGEDGLLSFSMVGTTDGILTLAVDSANMTESRLFPSATVTTKAGEVLGADKAAPATYSAAMDPTQQQIVIQDYENNNLVYLGELLHVTTLGFTATQTIPEAWNTTAPADNDIFVPTDTSAGSVGGTDSLNIPHAAALLDQFTLYDVEFTPGLINLNTASAELLYRSLPIADIALRTDVVNQIIDYRDQTPGAMDGNRTTYSNRTMPGIAQTGELIELLRGLSNATDGADTSAINGVLADFGSEGYNVDNTAIPTVPEVDDIADDQEEQVLLAKWLAQVTSTRSDCFAAYIWVREHDADDFTSSTDERRLIAVLHRGAGGNTTVLGTLSLD